MVDNAFRPINGQQHFYLFRSSLTLHVRYASSLTHLFVSLPLALLLVITMLNVSVFAQQASYVKSSDHRLALSS